MRSIYMWPLESCFHHSIFLIKEYNPAELVSLRKQKHKRCNFTGVCSSFVEGQVIQKIREGARISGIKRTILLKAQCQDVVHYQLQCPLLSTTPSIIKIWNGRKLDTKQLYQYITFIYLKVYLFHVGYPLFQFRNPFFASPQRTRRFRQLSFKLKHKIHGDIF
jgi:hypothetical protein